ncbi:hypothetical protein [Halorubrum sp. SD626R]|uniref:hypothetical protein n=1 Tax=Halorubrum sp. SD626R TaxID=1419722 RepID=UPI000AFD5596|nr:hypothetical protein [Halorubrum sp. SD626R]
MTVVGPAAFAVLLWGTLFSVSLVFVYEAYAIADESGWTGHGGRRATRSNRGEDR